MLERVFVNMDHLLEEFIQLKDKLRVMETEVHAQRDELYGKFKADRNFIIVLVFGRLVVMQKENAVKHLFEVWPSTKTDVRIIYPYSHDLHVAEIQDVLLQYLHLTVKYDTTFSEKIKQLAEMQKRHSFLFNEVKPLLYVARQDLKGDNRFTVFSLRGDLNQHLVRKDYLHLVLTSDPNFLQVSRDESKQRIFRKDILATNISERKVLEVDFLLDSDLWSDEVLFQYWKFSSCFDLDQHTNKDEANIPNDSIFTCDGNHQMTGFGDVCWKCKREEDEAFQLLKAERISAQKKTNYI